MILIVAGVAGSGKTTVATLLAERLKWPFADADALHPVANVEKMRAGVPLTDDDRRPWLQAVGAWMDEQAAAGDSAVVTCSALRRSYRDELLDGRPGATMVFLKVSKETLLSRVATRRSHFFPALLLNSQFAILEPPAPDEREVLVVPAEGPADETVANIVAAVWPDGRVPWSA